MLAEIKADRDFSTVPVVVLTTSEAEEDILRSYERQANADVTKSVDFVGRPACHQVGGRPVGRRR